LSLTSRVRLKVMHTLGDASNYAGSARLALLEHPQRKGSLASRITLNLTLTSPSV